MKRAVEAQRQFAEFSQEQVDRVVESIAAACEENAARLAKMAVEETGFGIYEDKILKNLLGSRITYESIKDMTPDDAARYGVRDGETVSVKLSSPRPVTLNDVPVRVRPNFSLAMHIDFDEANASMADKNTTGQILR